MAIAARKGLSLRQGLKANAGRGRLAVGQRGRGESRPSAMHLCGQGPEGVFPPHSKEGGRRVQL